MPPFIAALGDFDGVHIGHREVIGAALSAARELSLSSAVWFFSDSPKNKSGRLTGNEEKIKLFSSLGVDIAICVDFDDVKNLPPEAFPKKCLVPIGCRGIVCGFNFRFGKDAAGDTALLETLCSEENLFFKAVPPVVSCGITVSSTAIRAFLAAGDVKRASEMLGRDFSLSTPVSHGRSLGTKLGFPTINQNFETGCAVPRHGVYFTVAEYDGKLMPSVSNVGSRPTVGGHVCRLETHILNCGENFYGKTVTVRFSEFRRDEVRFSSEDELVAAVKEDVEAAKEYFSENKDTERRPYHET